MNAPGASLRAAASRGDAATCARLLNGQKCVRFSRDEFGRTAIHLAAQAGHVTVVRLLLSVAAPKEIDTTDGDGCTALQRAAADGHEDVIKLLLARGADPDKQDAVHGNGALHEAAWKGYSKTIRLLATAGAKLDTPNAGGFTPLHLCCQNGHNQSCRELLLAGCDADAMNNYGDTPAHTAARYGHAGVTRILISAKCKVNVRNKNGDTWLHIAAAMGRRKLTRIALEAGCDKKARNKQGETARDIALRKELREIVAIIDEKKSKSGGKAKVRFDTKQTDNQDGWSPYGCHYYPDPEAFPSPKLDSLPDEPLRKGEQYYLDLAGNIRKGPVGVGYTCYCAPLFRHLEAKLEKDKRELLRAQTKLGQRVDGLESKLNRGMHARRSERVLGSRAEKRQLPRSRSLEMLDDGYRDGIQATRSMDELDDESHRPSVKELVARIQHQQQEAETRRRDENDKESESSEDEEAHNDEGAVMCPRTRSAVYESSIPDGAPPKHLEPKVIVSHGPPSTYVKYAEANARFAKLRLLDNGRGATNNFGDNVDRDTNNDSGYSTKVYGSSKGNSPSLSGQLDVEGGGATAASLV